MKEIASSKTLGQALDNVRQMRVNISWLYGIKTRFISFYEDCFICLFLVFGQVRFIYVNLNVLLSEIILSLVRLFAFLISEVF